MPRTISILALLQVTVIVLGFFAVASVMKVNGYSDTSLVRWTPLALFLRQHGPWLLIVPGSWILFATFAQRRAAGFFSNRVALIVGAALPVALMALFISAAVAPYTRSLWPG